MKFKKNIVLGIVTGTMLMSAMTVGAMSSTMDGWLYYQNPLTSAPRGYAKTMGYYNISAKCTAKKDGETNSKSISEDKGKNGGLVETDWVYGPTYASSGTTFTSKHTGYDEDKSYHTKTATYKY